MPEAGFELTYKCKQMFFAVDRFGKSLETGRKRALSMAGAFVRTKARTQILRRKKSVSAAGQPPSVHSTDSVATLKNILFYYDPHSRTTIVGPVLLNGKTSDIPVPGLLEFGGTVTIRRGFRKGKRATYKPRPFMEPALKQALPELPQYAKDLLGGNAKVQQLLFQ